MEDKAFYQKIAKFKVHNSPASTADPDAMAFNIINNKTLVVMDGRKTIPLKVPDYMQTLIIDAMRNPYGESTVRFRLYNYNNAIWAKMYINRNFLRKLGDEFCRAPDALSIIIIQKSTPNDTDKPGYTETDIEVAQNPQPIVGNYMGYLKLTPFDHQHNNIQWLRQTEENISMGLHKFEYLVTGDLVHLKTSRFDIYMDPVTHILYNSDSIWNTERVQTAKFKGGVLCDYVGSGKTLSMVGLILADKYRFAQPKSTVKKTIAVNSVASTLASTSTSVDLSSTSSTDDTKLKVTIKIKSKPMIVAKPAVDADLSTLSTSTSASTTSAPILPKTIPTIKAKIKPVESLSKKDENSEIDASKSSTEHIEPEIDVDATLILCPRRLIGQWIDEIAKYTSYLKVIEMSTMVHVNKYSYSDIGSYDVVVASFELLNGKTYRSQQYFTLNRIRWRRVIVDEGHEVLLHQLKKKADDLRVSTAIFGIPSTYRWVCTGTPLVFTISSLQAIISFICGLGHNQLSPILDNITPAEYKNMLELLFHKNTKESTANQIKIPDTIDHVEFLTFTPTEEAVYKAIPPTDTERQLQVCTNINVSEEDSGIVGGIILNLDQVTKAMATYHKGNCDKHELDILETEAKIAEIEENMEIRLDELNAEQDELEILLKKEKNKDAKAELLEKIQEIKDNKRKTQTNSKNRISNANALIGRINTNLAESRKQVQIFRSIDVTHISKSKCPILGTPLSSDKVAITPDGYYYSQKGISLLFTGGRKSIMCPYLRKPIEQSELLIVDPKVGTNDGEMDVDRAKWGTKMIHVIRTLRKIFKEDETNRVIIFSRWTKMLVLMSHALKDNKINFVFCRGNVHVMKKSIRQFKSDDTFKVMLLSSESCNSGTNLTEASYVFLLDSVGADVEQTKAVEEQAIARAKRLGQKKNVHVYRFVIKDTVEEKYYEAMKTARATNTTNVT